MLGERVERIATGYSSKGQYDAAQRIRRAASVAFSERGWDRVAEHETCNKVMSDGISDAAHEAEWVRDRCLAAELEP